MRFLEKQHLEKKELRNNVRLYIFACREMYLSCTCLFDSRMLRKARTLNVQEFFCLLSLALADPIQPNLIVYIL